MRNLLADGFYRLFLSHFNSKDKYGALDRPIFIWGAPRSGTTLLYRLVAKHPEVGYPMTDTKIPREGADFWWRAFGEQRSTMDAELAHPRGIGQIYADYARLLKTQRKSRLLDKIPFLTLWIPLVNEIFPEARHFHIIRDGRAVVNSILYKLRYSDKPKDRRFRDGDLLFGPRPPELIDPLMLPPAQRHTRQWMLLVKHGLENAKYLGDRYFELRYENLVDDPHGQIKRVLDHAQLNYNDQLITETLPEKLTNRNYKWQSGNKQLEDDGYTARQAVRSEDRKYLQEMDPLLKSLGYRVDENGHDSGLIKS